MPKAREVTWAPFVSFTTTPGYFKSWRGYDLPKYGAKSALILARMPDAVIPWARVLRGFGDIVAAHGGRRSIMSYPEVSGLESVEDIGPAFERGLTDPGTLPEFELWAWRWASPGDPSAGGTFELLRPASRV